MKEAQRLYHVFKKNEKTRKEKYEELYQKYIKEKLEEAASNGHDSPVTIKVKGTISQDFLVFLGKEKGFSVSSRYESRDEYLLDFEWSQSPSPPHEWR